MICRKCKKEYKKMYGKCFYCFKCYRRELSGIIAEKRELLKTLFYLAGEDMLEDLIRQDIKLWERITHEREENRIYHIEYNKTHRKKRYLKYHIEYNKKRRKRIEEVKNDKM